MTAPMTYLNILAAFFLQQDVIQLRGGQNIQCKVEDVKKDSVLYTEEKQKKNIPVSKVWYIKLKDFPEQFSEAVIEISEGKYLQAQGKVKDLLKAVADKKIKDRFDLIKQQAAYLDLYCDIKIAKYARNQKLQQEMLDKIEKTYLVEFKDSFILFRILEALLMFYSKLNDLDKYAKLLDTYKGSFQPADFDVLGLGLVDHYLAEGNKEKALEILNKWTYTDFFDAGLRKAQLLFEMNRDRPENKADIEALVSAMQAQAKEKEQRFIVNYLGARLDFISGDAASCVGRLAKEIAFLDPQGYERGDYVGAAMELLSQAYESLAGKAETYSKVRYLAMAASTLRELVSYYPNIKDKARIILQVKKLEEQMESASEADGG